MAVSKLKFEAAIFLYTGALRRSQTYFVGDDFYYKKNLQ